MNVKDLVMTIRLSIALILLTCGLAVGERETFQIVEREKIPGILRTISNQTKANFEQIHTWQGELESSRYSIDRGENAKRTFETMTDAVGPCPNEVAKLESSSITFRCDLGEGMSYSMRRRETPASYFDPADGRDLGTKSIPDWGGDIMTKEYRLSAEPSAMKNGEVIQRKAVKEKADIDGPGYKGLQPIYLPTYVFNINSQVWGYYPRVVEIIEEKGEYVLDGYVLKVEQRTLSGDVQYRVHEPSKTNSLGINNFWTINTFSANAGYNRISWETTTIDGKTMQKLSTEYRKVNDVYVPIKNIEHTYDFRDFRPRVHIESVFKNIRINDVIPAETFTYKNLGLKDGDKFIDKIEGNEYKYQDANLVPITEPNNPP